MSATTAGPARAAFERLIARFAVGLRVGGAIAGSVGALLGVARPAAPTVVAVAGLLGWTVSYATLTRRIGWRRWLVTADVVVASALCLGYDWLVPDAILPGWATWLAVVASSVVIVSQLSPWPTLGFGATLAVPAAYAIGSRLAGSPAAGLAALLATQGSGAGVLMWLLRRHAQAADDAIARQEALQRDAAIRSGVRAEEREHRRLLHDSVSATLTVVAAGGVVGVVSSANLRAQARRDLAVLERIQSPVGGPPVPGGGELAGGGGVRAGPPDTPCAEPPPGWVGLLEALEPVVSAQPELAVERSITAVAVPAPVAAALAGAVAEALRNVIRHSGTNKVRLYARLDRGAVRVELTDSGRGFDSALVSTHRRGLYDSVVTRMSRVGGSAMVGSQPGAGTRIVLRWPAQRTEPAGGHPAGDQANSDHPAGHQLADHHPNDHRVNSDEANGPAGFGQLVTARYLRGFEWAVVWLTAVRHTADAFVPIVAHRWAYRSVGAELAAWTLMAAVGVVAGLRLLWHRTDAVVSWLLAAAVLAASALATAAVANGQELTAAHWALGGTGWFGVLVLLRRPIRELAALITINSSLTLVLLVADGAADRVNLARFLMMTYALAALQVGFALLVSALDGTTRQAAAATEKRTAVTRRTQVAEALHRGRLDRYQTVRRSLVPLLVGLAAGELDPADPRVQRRCAVEGSRLRRLFAETDDVPDPLLHELRACADIAYRRGVQVDLQVVGQLPALSRPVRRALTEAPLHALAGARREARVTVFGRPDDVAVSVLADTQPGESFELPTPFAGTLRVPEQGSVVVRAWEGDNRRWLEARWRGPDSPSGGLEEEPDA